VRPFQFVFFIALVLLGALAVLDHFDVSIVYDYRPAPEVMWVDTGGDASFFEENHLLTVAAHYAVDDEPTENDSYGLPDALITSRDGSAVSILAEIEDRWVFNLATVLHSHRTRNGFIYRPTGRREQDGRWIEYRRSEW
jgi:hypothetical protein